MTTSSNKTKFTDTTAIDNPDVIVQPPLSTPEVQKFFAQMVTDKYQRLMQSELEQFESKIKSFTQIGGIESYLQRDDLKLIRNLPDLYSKLHLRCLESNENDFGLVQRLTHQMFDMQKWQGRYKSTTSDPHTRFEVGFRLMHNKTRPPKTVLKNEFSFMDDENPLDVGLLLISPDRSRIVVVANPSSDINEHPRNYEIAIINCKDGSYKMVEKITRFLIGFTKDNTQRFGFFTAIGLELL